MSASEQARTASHTRTAAGCRSSMRAKAPRVLAAALLGLAAAVLVSCAGSTKGLIPASAAGPLQSDFETVQQAAENGDGSCAATEASLLKTSEDFGALPASVNAGLRNNLSQGIANLRTRALALCAQPLPQTTSTNAAPKTTTTSTATTPTVTETTPTTTTPTVTTTAPTTTGPEGGTPAPGVGETGAGSAPGGGTGAGESATGGGAAGAGGGAGASEQGANGQEAAK
jgi:hypothetical protein